MFKSKIDVNFSKLLEYIFLVLTFISFFFACFYAFNNLDNPILINLMLALPFFLFLTPYLFLSLYDLRKVEMKMEIVPRFLRDIVDNVESGMDLISSIKSTINNEYGALNEDIKKLVNQLSWGINFEDAFLNFSKNVGSFELRRDFLLIIEARKVGGHVEKILRELSIKITTDILRKKERKSNLASNTFTGYVSFIIFIVIIILVYNSLFVEIGQNLTSDDFSNNSEKMEVYLSLLMFLSYELAILSGFLFGLMQENNVIKGGPHVVILIIFTFLGFFFLV